MGKVVERFPSYWNLCCFGDPVPFFVRGQRVELMKRHSFSDIEQFVIKVVALILLLISAGKLISTELLGLIR